MQQIHLIRGYQQVIDDDGALVISAGHNEMMLTKARGIHFQFAEPGSEPDIQINGRLDCGELQRFSQGFHLTIPELDAEVYCGVLAWWTFPNFNLPTGRRLFYIPLRGWFAGVWYDGPLAHYSPKGMLASFVPPGAPARLSIPWQAQEPAAEVVPYVREFFVNETMKWLALRTSAAYGLYEQLACKMGCRAQVRLQNLNAYSAVLLCLLRMAFPDDYLECEGVPEVGDLARLWVRLCRNLDIRVHKDPRLEGEIIPIELERYEHLIPEHCLQRLVEALNHQSPVIPVNLLRDMGFLND